MPMLNCHLRRMATALAMLAGALALSGCSIAGSWRVVSIDPPGAPFPVQVLTLDPNNNYTATGPEHAKPCTTTGQYRFNGSRLEVVEGGRMPRTYGARRQMDGSLVLTYEERGVRVRATLVRTEE